MRKLAELWAAKKGLCVGIIATVVVLTAGGIATAVVVSSQSGRKTEVQVASDETIESTNKDNQTTKAAETKETTQKASEATTEESKEGGSSETQMEAPKEDKGVEPQVETKSNDGEHAGNSETLGNPTESDNMSSNNTQGSNNHNVSDNTNQRETGSTGGSNSTENKNTESSSETQAPVVVHGANGVILDTLIMYKKSIYEGAIPVPKTTDEITNSDTSGYGSTINSSETPSVFKDGINFKTSKKADIISRYGEPYEIRVENGVTCLLYRYGNYTSDENKVVYIAYCCSENDCPYGEKDVLYGIYVGSYKSMFE